MNCHFLAKVFPGNTAEIKIKAMVIILESEAEIYKIHVLYMLEQGSAIKVLTDAYLRISEYTVLNISKLKK